MTEKSKYKELQKINSLSLNIIQDKTQNIPSNKSQLKIIYNLVEDNKKNGHKYSLISCLFLLFYKSGKDTLLKKEINNLLEEEISKNRNKIISSHTGRSCMINLVNYRRKVKDILKKKKWFTKRINEDKEIEYKMNNKIVAPILPRIISQLKSIEKNKDDIEEILIEENENESNKKDENQISTLKMDEVKNKEEKENVNENKNDITIEENKNKEIQIKEDEKKNNNKIKDKKEEKIEEYDNNKKENINDNIKVPINNINSKAKFICKKRSNPQFEIKNGNNKVLIKKKLFLVHRKEQNDNFDFINDIKSDERIMIDNKLDSILNKGEVFINMINNQSLSNNTSRKIIELKKTIEEKQKELDLEKLNLEKIISNEQKLKCYNKDDIEDIINKIKDNYKEYKNKIEILILFGKIINKSEVGEDIKSIIFNYKAVYSKCTSLLNKIFLGLTKLLKEYLNVEDIFNILALNENEDRSQKENNILNGNINESIKNLEVLFKKELNDTLSSVNLTLEDSLSSVINSETNFNSCLNSNLSINSFDNNNIIGNSSVNNEILTSKI